MTAMPLADVTSCFVVDASSPDSFAESWAILTGSFGGGSRLPSAYEVAG